MRLPHYPILSDRCGQPVRQVLIATSLERMGAGMGFSVELEAIDVSAEMLTLLGAGDAGRHRWPPRSIAFEFDDQLRCTFHATPRPSSLKERADAARMIMLIDLAACERLYGSVPEFEDGATYLLPADLRAIAVAIRGCQMPTEAALPYRLAKSIEFVCEILRALRAGELIAAGRATLSLADYRRVAAARQLIEDHWEQPLSLSSIARRCGLNRSKLSRGFRELYRCSVTEALSERRLCEARRQLLATDLPVGLIGYRTGYQNNASFSRAFCRRFGVPPSDFRAGALAA